MYKFRTNYDRMFENIVGSAYTYIAASKVKALVIGMSGGIDSTLTAAIAKEVVKRLDNGVVLEGRVIDITSKEEEIERGLEASATFCNISKYVNLNELFYTTVSTITESRDIDNNSFEYKVRLGNIKARLRMIQLYDLAKKLNGLVLSTDNYTEYLLGFWTLHGDVGDFGMIQNLWKTEVYGLTEYLADTYNKFGRHVEADVLQEAIEAVPTDGLGITDSDFDQLCSENDRKGSPREVYGRIDTLLYDYLYNKGNSENKVAMRHRASKFKRNNPANVSRMHII